MKFFVGGLKIDTPEFELTHDLFSERNTPGHELQTVTKGLVNAFLRHFLQGDSTYWKNYIVESGDPGASAIPIFTQYSHGTFRRVIENAERSSLTSATPIGGTVTPNSWMASLSLHTTSTTTPSPHKTRVLIATTPAWSGLQPAPAITWTIPTTQSDWTTVNHCNISLRFSQLTAGTPTIVELGIMNGTTTTWETLNNYAPIPTPAAVAEFTDEETSAHIAPMQTFRFPLSNFGTLTSVSEVYLRFPESGASREFMIDNLEIAGCDP